MNAVQPQVSTDKRVPRRRYGRRICFWLLIGLLTIGGGVAYKELWLERPMGSGPAGPAVDRTRFAKPWTDRKVLLFGAGDSITAGLGARTPAHGYFNRLVACSPDEYPDMAGICLSAVLPNLSTLNIAVSGSNSLDHVAAVQDGLPRQSADTLGFVVLTTGGNDLIHWYGLQPPKEGAMYGATRAQAQPWIDRFAQRLETLLNAINERFPGGCHIFLGDIYDPTDGVGDAVSARMPDWPDALAIHSQYNAILRSAAERRANVHLVPLYDTFLGHGIHCRQFWRKTYRRDDPTYWFWGNIEDPNDRGHDAIRRAFLMEIARVADGL
jgi:lysophospholipase L1-like esterase